MNVRLTLIDVQTTLGIVRVHGIASVTHTQIAAIADIVTELLATSSLSLYNVLALASIVASLLVTAVTAIVLHVTYLVPSDTPMIATLKLGEDTRTRSGSADRHIVFIAVIVAVSPTVAHLVARNTLFVSALEFLIRIAREVATELGRLIASIPAVIDLITAIT